MNDQWIMTMSTFLWHSFTSNTMFSFDFLNEFSVVIKSLKARHVIYSS